MKRNIIAVAVALAFSNIVSAAPTCEIVPNGEKMKVTIADTGVVYRTDLKQTPPTGAVVYQGTGRKVDRSVSCKDNVALCNGASWFLRFTDARQGWPGDADVAKDPRVIACSFDAGKLAQVCEFTLADGMKTAKGDVRMHYGAKVGNTVVAAYQPQGGNCYVAKDGLGNPHTVVTAATPPAK